MEDRRNLERESIKYEQTDRMIHRLCIEAKERYINGECHKIESLKHTNLKMFYKSIEDITGKKSIAKVHCLKDSEGKILMNNEDILKRWAEYIEQLYDDNDRKRLNRTHMTEECLPILKHEVEAACREMKKGKATGQDGISIELIEALGDRGIDALTKIFNVIYYKGELPEELRKSVFITLPKKAGAIDCEHHRTICIMSQATKMLLRIMMKRMRSIMSREIGKEQFGFVKDKGTVNAIFTLKSILQRSIEKQKNVIPVLHRLLQSIRL